jgi:hypothetical protein
MPGKVHENDMASVVRFHEVGGPEVLTIEEIDVLLHTARIDVTGRANRDRHRGCGR